MVSNIFYFHPYLVKWSNLTSIFFRWVGSTTNKCPLWRICPGGCEDSLSQGPCESELRCISFWDPQMWAPNRSLEVDRIMTTVSRMKYPQLPHLLSVMYMGYNSIYNDRKGPTWNWRMDFLVSISQGFYLRALLITRTFVHVTFVKGLLRTYT